MTPLICMALALLTTDNTWPGFRGDGTSISTAQNVPLHWSPGKNLAWKTALPGYGQSSPIVWGTSVFVTSIEGREKEQCLVAALATENGKFLWQRQFPASRRGRNNAMMSRAAPTPVVDDKGLYVLFECGDLHALDHQGKVLWHRCLAQEFGDFKNNHGLGSSLAQTEQAVIVLVDHAGPSFLLAIDKRSGKTLWKADRPSRTSWTSPVVAGQGEEKMIVVSSSGAVTAYAADTGKQLWEIEGLTGNNIVSPVIAGERIIVGAGENRLKPDAKASAESNCCLRLVKTQGKAQVEMAWRGRKAISHHASPLVHGNEVYVVTRLGVVHCLDLATGQEHYSQRLDNPCWATPLAVGGLIYFFGKDGVTTVLRAGPRFEKVAVNRLWEEETFAARKEQAKQLPENQPTAPPARPSGKEAPPPVSPQVRQRMLDEVVGDLVYGAAVIDNALFLRSGTELYCIRASR